MRFGWIRRRLGVLTTLWLCGQVMSLSAFAVNLCCLSADEHRAHQPADALHAPTGQPHANPAATVTATDGASAAATDAATPTDPHAGHHQHAEAATPPPNAARATADGGAADDVACASPLVDHCPMAGANGEPCPMHAGGPGRMAAADCAMRGPCSGTDAALLSFLWAPGVLVTQTFDAHLAISPAVVAPMFVVLSADPRIDTPPPRA